MDIVLGIALVLVFMGCVVGIAMTFHLLHLINR